MIFKRRPHPQRLDRLTSLVGELLPEADAHTRELVASIVGLLACVAYADGEYRASEREGVRRELARVQALSPSAVDAVCALLDRDIEAIAAGGDQPWAQRIRDGLEREGRLEVLDALLEIAAADGELSTAETNFLRRLVPKLGLGQEDYVHLQSRHRGKLSVLSAATS